MGNTLQGSGSLPFNIPMPPAAFPPEEEDVGWCLSSIRLTASEEKNEESPQKDQGEDVETKTSKYVVVSCETKPTKTTLHHVRMFTCPRCF